MIAPVRAAVVMAAFAATPAAAQDLAAWRTPAGPPVRAAAVYWLGVGDGEEALALLEGVLRGR